MLNQLDAVHPRHVDIAHQQIIRLGPQCVPAVLAVDGHIDVVAVCRKQLPFDLAHGDRIVDDEHPGPVPDSVGGQRSHASQPSFAQQLPDRMQQILDIDDQQRLAFFGHRRGRDVRDLAQSRVQRPDHQILFADEAIDHDAAKMLILADHHDAQRILVGRSAAEFQDFRPPHQSDRRVIQRELLLALHGSNLARPARARCAPVWPAETRTTRRRSPPAPPE